MFAVVQGLGVIFAKQPERAAEEFFTFLVEAVALYFLIVNAVRSEQALRGVTWALCLTAILMGGVPLIQQVRGDFENQYGGLAQTPDEPGFLGADNTTIQRRMAGPIGEKNRYGQIMLMLVPLSLFRLRDERSPWLRGLAVVTLLFAATGVYLSFSRSTILCAGLVMLLAAALGHVNRKWVTLVVIVGFGGLLMTPQYRARLASLADLRELFNAGKHSQADGALKGRATEMGAAALVFLDHPLIGVGPGEFKFYSREYGERIGIRALAPERQAHCLPLDVAAENGFLGLCCLIGVIGVQGWRLLQQTNNSSARPGLRSLSAGCLYMLAAYAATGLFLHFAFIRYFWLMIALGDAAILIGRKDATENP
jgi:O-antigen ligase